MPNWFREYQLFLFDFDGLLVNTEHLHWEAYRQLCANHGYGLGWTFAEFCDACHRDSMGPRIAIYGLFPELEREFPDWTPLYEEKCELYTQLLKKGEVKLMPGVLELLELMEERQIKRAVVTHSRASHLALIRKQLPQLNTIPHWVTREDYTKPKPDPECYLKAIAQLSTDGERAVGFEDTPRGIRALKGTPAQPVIVAEPDYPLLSEALTEGVIHLTSLRELLATA